MIGLKKSSCVGTPGLGYPFLLCLGKGLEVILNYVQTAGPLWSRVLISRQRFRTCLTTGKEPETTRVPEEAGSPNSRGSGPLEGSGPPRKSRTPHRVPDPLYGNRTPRWGKKSTPCLEVVRSRHVSASTDTCTRPLGLQTKPHPPLHSLC